MKIAIGGSFLANFTLWWLFVSWISNIGVYASCPVGTFGHLCSYTCHCAFDAPCDPDTGACFGECAPGFSGEPYCQLENIAIGKPTYQETSITDNSALAVDGKRNQTGTDNSCSWSVNFRYPFRTLWRVDLLDTYSINEIKVFFKNDTNVSGSRRFGARVYVSKTEEFHLDPVCYTSHLKGDVLYQPPPVLDLTNCTNRGQYVVIYNQRPVVDSTSCPKTEYSCWANLELCEVEVYACTYGTFGPKCDRQCHCKGSTCDQRTGLCPAGCVRGWTGSECDMECPTGTYGENCDTLCGKCLSGETCDKITGKCERGCEPGWMGERCTQMCPQFTYGNNCTEACFNCANLTDCDKKTGVCTFGCADGYFGKRCLHHCPVGTYGKTCEHKCGKCADDEPCDSHTGKCPKHCQPGYSSPLCRDACLVGSYGANCTGTCGRCKDYDPCHHITGECTGGCSPGYSGLHCVIPCKHGTFGYDCAKECSTCTDQHCDYVTGECKHGCKPGFQDPKCDRRCPAGLYGSNCIHVCGQCADHLSCDPLMGHCPTKCSPGWRGTHCNIPCSDGFYGDDCKETCGHCHNNTACDAISGQCIVGCQDGFHGLQCRAVNSEGMKMSGGVIGCLVGAVVVIGFIVVACSLRRYKFSKDAKTADKETNVVYNSENVITDGSMGINMAFSTQDHDYYNVGKEPRGIPVVTMKEFLQRLDDSVYQNEFEQLRNVPIFPHTAGQKAENKCKNRFLTTFPYDHSRVVLKPIQGESESDYINANFIDSVDSRKVYIAAQGPNRLTVRDFWRMIWQEKVETVIMLANIFEDGKLKCEKYWPENKPLRYCDVLISLDECLQLSTYSVRHITVGNVKTSETRKVIQYHFTGWPDHGIPDTIELVEFHRRVVQDSSSQTGPLLVHCSAGVGRTGTFIALDALYKYGQKGTYVDVNAYVRKMRESRMTMIQNAEQYKLLHYALLEALTYRKTSISRQEFPTVYEQMKHDGKRRIEEEFKALMDIKPTHSNVDCSVSLCQDNIQKNRALDVLPVDKYRPFLSTHIHGTNNYINGVMIPSYARGSNYIITQTPLSHTVVDFWRLLFDHECKTIVSLNLVDEEEDEQPAIETGVWWPSEGESISYGPLKIKTESVSDIHDAFTQRTFSITKRNYGDPRTIRSFHFTKWPSNSRLPVSKHSLLSLLDAVERWKNDICSENIVVQCMNGANCSGLYCAISLVLDNMRLKKEVDVYHAVQKVQARRSQLLNTVEQYEYLYEMVSEFIDSRDIYINLE